MLPRTLGAVSVPGMDGELPTGQALAPFDLGLTLTIMGRDPSLRELVRQQLAAQLNVDGEAPLAISEDGGLWYKARPTAQAEGVRSVNAESFDVTFRISDPVRYGTLRTVTVPQGGSVTFTVGGTYPTMPNVTATIDVGDGTEQWRLGLDDGSYLLCYAPSTSGQSSYDVAFDCSQRVLTVGGEVIMLPAIADWLVLAPGEHTLTMSGDASSGAATVTFYERWV